jgi:LysM repeat protein
MGVVLAFDDCIERLGAGESVEACLARYPEYIAQLTPMLAAVNATARAAELDAEWAEVSPVLAARFERALAATSPRRRTGRVFGAAAALILALLVALGGVTQLAGDSLPGDPLYGVKRLSESVEAGLSAPAEALALRATLEARRVAEVSAVMAAGRAVEVDFSGVIERVTLPEPGSLAPDIAADAPVGVVVIAGLPVRVNAGTLRGQPDLPARLRVGLRVAVSARTTTDGALDALALLPEPEDETPNDALDPSATVSPTLLPIPSPTASSSTSPSITSAALTALPTASPSPTATPSATASASVTPSPSPSATATASASPTASATIIATGVCVIAPPPGWVSYIVQPGDTLSDLAVRTETTLDLLVRVNCLEDARRIIAGLRLYLPRAPLPRIGATATPGIDPALTPPPGVDELDPNWRGTLEAARATLEAVRQTLEARPTRDGRRRGQ